MFGKFPQRKYGSQGLYEFLSSLVGLEYYKKPKTSFLAIWSWFQLMRKSNASGKIKRKNMIQASRICHTLEKVGGVPAWIFETQMIYTL